MIWYDSRGTDLFTDFFRQTDGYKQPDTLTDRQTHDSNRKIDRPTRPTCKADCRIKKQETDEGIWTWIFSEMNRIDFAASN